MPDITIESWGHLQEELFKGSWNDMISRYRSPFVFRGLSDKSYMLKTSLIRLGGPYWQLEKHLLRNFRKYARMDTDEQGSFWHLMAIAQHYGLPTRLLDWTYSPYVALHFATANLEKYPVDGVIWVVDFEKAHDRLPGTLRNLLRTEGAQAFTVELLANLRQRECAQPGDASFQQFVETLTEFDAVGQDQDFLLFFEPPSMNDRIVNQFALFSVMPNPKKAIDTWLDENPDLFRRIIIPAGMKWECRDKLDQCNITERVLFPGLDGLGSWLKRHYNPKT
jgi:hypothetical protein